MRRGGAWLAAMSAGAVVLAAWVSTARFVPVLRGAVDQPISTRPVVSPRLPGGPGGNQERHLQQPTSLGPVVTTFIYVVLSLFALALLAIIWRQGQSRRRRRAAAHVVTQLAAEDTFDDIGAGLAGDLSRSAERGLAALDHGNPSDAIIRCWMMLEEAVIRAGLGRNPALTSEEFTVAVLSRYQVRAAAIAELAGLYR
ncbi:MAG: hypothetical protein WAK18_14015, partial [Nocardioidaceae bacterium]